MSSMSKFSILKLPILCADSILCSFEIYYLICFSTLSKRCYRLVKTLRNTLTGINVDVGKWAVVSFRKNDETVGSWSLTQKKGIVITKMSPPNEGKRYYPCLTKEKDPKLSVKAGIKHLLNLFKLTTVHYFIINAHYVPQNFNVLVVDKCEKLQITGSQPVTNDRLAYIIYNTITDRVIFGKTEPNFELDTERFKVKQLFFCNECLWFTGEMMLKLNFSILRMAQTTIRANDSVEFVNNWMNSNNTEIECVMLTGPSQNFTSYDIFEHLGLRMWNENQRSRYFPITGNLVMDLKVGVDIKRKDGLWATIRVFHDGFFFCVWHNRFHDVTGKRIFMQVED